jgi:hypothetical protein
VNPHSGALGYGQVMPQYVAKWTKEALGKSLTPREFLNNPKAQLATINHRLAGYLKLAMKQSKGNLSQAVRRVAAMWYAGQSNSGNFASMNPQSYAGHAYPSIGAYTADILSRFNKDRAAGANYMGNIRPLQEALNKQPGGMGTGVMMPGGMGIRQPEKPGLGGNSRYNIHIHSTNDKHQISEYVLECLQTEVENAYVRQIGY